MRRARHPRRSVPAWALGAIAVLSGAPTASAITPAERAAQTELVRQINVIRVQHDRAPLRQSALLARPARRQAAWVARTGDLSHLGPDGSPFWVRLYRAGFPRTKAVGENLGLSGACRPGAARAIVRMWMRSPGHRDVLLSPRFRVVGTGVVVAPGGRATGFTADFGG